jgi:hypothetical protein
VPAYVIPVLKNAKIIPSWNIAKDVLNCAKDVLKNAEP